MGRKESNQTNKSLTLVCLTASFLANSGFNYFKMYAWSTSMLLLLLHLAFMLSKVKMLLKGEVGGSALNSHPGQNI